MPQGILKGQREYFSAPWGAGGWTAATAKVRRPMGLLKCSMDRMEKRFRSVQSGQESRIYQVPTVGNNSPLIIAAGADYVPCRVEITAEPTLPVHPYAKQQSSQVVNRFAAIPAQSRTAHADDTALAGLRRRLPLVKARI